jgi:hypothetical protein
VSLAFVSNEEIIQEARRRLDQETWYYLVGGSESETTLRRNRLAFDRIAFRTRVLVDVSHIDPSTTHILLRLGPPQGREVDAGAQQTGKVYRIGRLGNRSPARSCSSPSAKIPSWRPN